MYIYVCIHFYLILTSSFCFCYLVDEIPNLLLDDEPILKNVTGCEIKWNEPTSSNCLTFKEVTKKQRSKSGKRAGQIRTVKKKEKTDSFFHFFW
jgi:nucleosome assembly protein 1-like 1